MELTYQAARSGRLSGFLTGEMGMSTGLMNRCKWQGTILVNGVPRHTGFAVSVGDVICVRLEEPEPEYPAEDGPLAVRFEDDHLLAVDKPAGVLIHPSRVRNEGTLANLVAGYYRRTGQSCIFHPVTRLDRDTFGLVLLAKNGYIHAAMNDLHRQGRLQKTYHALVFGGPTEDAGILDAPIARKPLPSLLREIREDGKPARTEYRVLWRGEGCAKLALRPVTGRTHQLRLHCAHFGFPILGDPQYHTEDSARFSAGLGWTSQALCAVEVRFPHPVTGEAMCLRSGMDVMLPDRQ